MNDDRKRMKTRRRQKGSALLVSLMVMVGLSLLGLGYVAISETESAISINERNAAQTREVAEAGLKVVVEWFQDPEWANTQSILPPNIDDIKTDRIIDAASIGRYKTSGFLFDKPHKGADVNRFFGDEDHADVWITNAKLSTSSVAANRDFLNDLNKTLFNSDYTAGRITEIRVYAPPMSSATYAAGFYKPGFRLGLASIMVTATKCRDDSDANPCASDSADSRVISRRTVRAVISEWPFPGPSGPVQTNANLGTNGDVRVHWGKVTATGTMKLKRPYGSLPWHDAWEPVHFQHGYHDQAGAANDPWPSDAASADNKNKYNWLWAIIGKELEDPWYEGRSRGDYSGDGVGGDPVPYGYQDPAADVYDDDGGTPDWFRAVFQFQTKDEKDDYKSVLFPKFNYDFWKDVAKTADDQDNVFYLTWEEDDTFSDKDGNEKTVEEWVNVKDADDPGKAGYYFFETEDSQNPQDDGGGTLTPGFQIKGNPFHMQGFFYFNSLKWDSAGGAKAPDGYYAMPGEPYKDDAYWLVNNADGQWVMAGGNHVWDTPKANNGQWDYQDLNLTTHPDNDEFDYAVGSRTVTRPGTTDTVTTYFILPYYPGCTPGTNCSEPHEPYLNYEHCKGDKVGECDKEGLVYYANQKNVKIGWSAGKGMHLPKKTSNDTAFGTLISCNTPPADETDLVDQCTSNSYDKDGPLVKIAPALNGVLYVEGEFEQTGNMPFFGSILANGDFGKAGTPDVYFDERLIKNEWPPKEFRFPRVFISSLQSD